MVQPTGNYTATLLLNTQYVVVIRSRTRGTIHHRCLACAFLWLIIPIFDPMRRSHSGKAILSLHPSIKVRTFQAARSGGILYIFFFRSGDSAVHPIRKIRLGSVVVVKCTMRYIIAYRALRDLNPGYLVQLSIRRATYYEFVNSSSNPKI
ncbi:hypothetical protein PGB90_008893 [Kerria lacca]